MSLLDLLCLCGFSLGLLLEFKLVSWDGSGIETLSLLGLGGLLGCLLVLLELSGLGESASLSLLLVVLGLLNCLDGLVVEDIIIVFPELAGLPEGEDGGVGALDVEGLNASPALGHETFDNLVDDKLDVLSELLRVHGAVANDNAGVGAGVDRESGGTDSASDGLGSALGVNVSADELGTSLSKLLPLVALLVLVVLASTLKVDRDRSGLGGTVEVGAEDLGKTSNNSVVGEEDLVVVCQLSAFLKGLAVVLFQTLDSDDVLLLLSGKRAIDLVNGVGEALTEAGGETVILDDRVVLLSGVGSDEDDAELLVVDVAYRVGHKYLARLQALLLGHVLLGCDLEADILDVLIVTEKVLLARFIFLRDFSRLNLLDKCARVALELLLVELVWAARDSGDGCYGCHGEGCVNKMLWWCRMPRWVERKKVRDAHRSKSGARIIVSPTRLSLLLPPNYITTRYISIYPSPCQSHQLLHDDLQTVASLRLTSSNHHQDHIRPIATAMQLYLDNILSQTLSQGRP